MKYCLPIRFKKLKAAVLSIKVLLIFIFLMQALIVSATVIPKDSTNNIPGTGCTPPPPPAGGPDQTVCATTPVQTLVATATPVSGATVVWFDAASGGHIVSVPSSNIVGIITYYAEDEESGCSSLTRTPVKLTINASPSLVITNPAAVCSPATVDITAPAVTSGSSLPPASTLTYFTDVATTNQASNPGAIAAGGTYYIKAFTSSSGCSSVAPVVVTVNLTPSLSIVNPAPVCAPATIDITTPAVTSGSTFPASTAVSYYVDAATTTPIANPTAIATGGTYYIKAQTAQGCSDIKPVTVTINAVPTITPGSGPIACTSINAETVYLFYNNVTGNPTTYTLNGWTNAGFTNVTNASLPASPIPITIAAGVSASTYTANLTVKNAAGCTSATLPIMVTVNQSPQIILTSASATTGQSVCVATAITPITYVTNGATGVAVSGLPPGVNYSYVSNLLTISGSPTTSGTFSYSATTTGGSCIEQVATGIITGIPSPTITLGTNPSACFSVSAQSVFLPYTATTSSPTTYTISNWSGGGFANVTNAALPANPITINVPAGVSAGVYTATLKVANANSCSTLSYPISVIIMAAPTITLGANPSTCFASNVQTVILPYSGTTGSPTTYSISGWSSGTFANITNSPLPANPINITVPGSTTAGVYTATLYVRNAIGCTSTNYPISVVINAVPTISVTPTFPTTCGGSDGSFTVSGLTPTINYTINYSKAGIPQAPVTFPASSGGSITVSNLTMGSYTNITATTTTNCVSNAVTTFLTQPVGFTPTLGTSGAVCEGSTLSLTSTTTTGAVFNWTGPNGFTSLLQNPTRPTAVFADSGLYTVTVSVSGCVSTASIVGVVHQSPVLTINTPAPVCSPSTINITAPAITAGSTLPSGTTLSYYTNPTATIVLANPAAIAVGGNYYITALTGAGCGDTVLIPVSINITPTISITTSQTYSTNLQTSSLGVTVSAGTVTSTAGTVVNTSGNNWTISNIPTNNFATITATSPASCSQTLFVDTLIPVHPGDSFRFIATTPAAGNTYQWQVNTGSGFTDLSNNSIYSGVTTDTLNITNAPSTMYGYQYQCVITNNSVVSYSFDYPLQFAEFWEGGISSSWEDPNNWSSGTLPDSNTDVYINGGAVILNSNVSVRSVTLNPAASLTVNNGFNLTVTH